MHELSSELWKQKNDAIVAMDDESLGVEERRSAALDAASLERALAEHCFRRGDGHAAAISYLGRASCLVFADEFDDALVALDWVDLIGHYSLQPAATKLRSEIRRRTEP